MLSETANVCWSARCGSKKISTGSYLSILFLLDLYLNPSKSGSSLFWEIKILRLWRLVKTPDLFRFSVGVYIYIYIPEVLKNLHIHWYSWSTEKSTKFEIQRFEIRLSLLPNCIRVLLQVRNVNLDFEHYWKDLSLCLIFFTSDVNESRTFLLGRTGERTNQLGIRRVNYEPLELRILLFSLLAWWYYETW